MPNNYLSVLNKHIIQVENQNVGLKVGGGGGGHKHTLPPNQKRGGGGVHAPLAAPPPRFLRQYILLLFCYSILLDFLLFIKI